MSKLLYTLLFSVLLGSSLVTSAQTLPDLKAAVERSYQGPSQEKVFVQTDKDFYLTGELMWFKVYAVDAYNNSVADLSKVAYVEVLDKQNNALLQAKVNLKKGSGSGSFYIPITSLNGSYKLRAYTNLMKNAGVDFFFEKAITIVNPLRDPEKEKVANTNLDLQFFPESGDLIGGIKSKVGFKATGSDGLGKNFTGVIVNQKNDTVARFKTFKFGIGNFIFTPEVNGSYKAIGRSSQGEIVIRELPAVKRSGVVLTVSPVQSGKIIVQMTTNFSQNQLFVILHSGKHVISAENVAFSNGMASCSVDEQKLSDGINQITVFDAAGQPVAERVFFKRPAKRLDIIASLNAGSFDIREQVKLELTTRNEKGAAMPADLSLSVYRLDSLQHMDLAGIVSYFWLKSELKGNIESPEYYVGNATAESTEALDNLMLTQGWRRFNQNGAPELKPAAETFLPEMNGHLITGKITNSDGQHAASKVVFMGIPGKRIQLYSAISDSTGNLMFNTKDLYGQNELIVQTNYERDSLYKITINNPFSENYTKNLLPIFNVKTDFSEQLSVRNTAAQVQNVYHGSKFRQFYYPGIDSTSFFGAGNKSYNLNDYVRFTTMEEVFREYVKEAFVSRRQKRFHIKVLTELGFLDDDPMVLLDGIPYFNLDRVFAMDPLKIQKMDVVTNRYYYGPSVSDGIISLTTLKGDLGGTEIDPHTLVMDYEGMQLQREFYMPVYRTEVEKNSRLPDYRNVLYWSPDVAVNATGKIKLDFYTSDLGGSYIGIVEGMTSTGIPGMRFFTFDVKSKK